MKPLSDDEIKQLEVADAANWAEIAPFMADYYTERELRLILNCMEYRDGDPAGLPGHNLMILVAKLAGGFTEERIYELLDMKAKAGAEDGE